MAGGLEAVLPELTTPAVPLLVMWPPSRRGDPRVAAFVAVMKALFARAVDDERRRSRGAHEDRRARTGADGRRPSGAMRITVAAAALALACRALAEPEPPR